MNSPEVVMISGLALSCVGLAIALYRARKTSLETRYIDTSGILTNPPKSYIDVWRGKTLNIKISKRHAIIVPHVSVPYGLHWLEMTAGSLTEIRRLMSLTKSIAVDLAIRARYEQAVQYIYRLTKPFGRIGYRVALYRKAKQDFAFMLDVIEQIFDFWMLVKKKILLLSQGQTLRGTDGEIYTWDSLKLDEHGKRLIVPRYVS